MKKTLLLTALLAGSAAGMMAATATVNLDNFNPATGDGIPLNPIYYLAPGTMAPGDVWVEVLGNGSVLGSAIKAASFDLTGDGKDDAYLFTAGTGEFPASVAGGADVTLQVRAWTGAATYDLASYKGETLPWTQKSGSWDKTAQPLPTPPDIALNMGGPLTIVVPEPSTIALGLLGAAALLLRRRK